MIEYLKSNPVALAAIISAGGVLIGSILNMLINGIFNYFNNKYLLNKTYIDDSNKKRIELYSEVLISINQLNDSNKLIFEVKYISSLRELNYKMMLFASKKVYEVFEKIFEYLNIIYECYEEEFYKYYPEDDERNIEFELNEETGGLDIETPSGTMDPDIRDQYLFAYKHSHGINNEKLKNDVKELCNTMKAEIGTNK